MDLEIVRQVGELLLAAGAGFGTARWLSPKREVSTSPLPSPAKRCYTITFHYSDGSAKTFHQCQGHFDFSDACGRANAPEGVTFLGGKGGVHQ